MAVNRIFGAISTSGGSSGALDDISISVITDGDIAIAMDNTLKSIHFYKYSSSSSLSEDYPTVIVPDDVVTTGRWLMVSQSHFMEDVVIESGNKILVNDVVGNGSGLQIGYESGSIDISIGSTKITLTKELYTNEPITSIVSTGTAPITVSSTTMCTGLNANYIGGKLSEDIIVRDGSTLFTSLPSVTNTGGVPDVIPSDDWNLTTKKYVDSLVGETEEHDSLVGAAESRIHTDYIFIDGTRPFTGAIGGVDPVSSSHLTTKNYVDTEILNKATNVHIRKDATILFTGIPGFVNTGGVPDITPTLPYHITSKKYVDGVVSDNNDHGGFDGLGDDDHTQYILVDGTRNFTQPIGYDNGTIVDSAIGDDFVTKTYIESVITDVTDIHIVKDGSIAFTGMPQVASTDGDPDIGPSESYHLVTVEYVSSLLLGGSIDHGELSGLSVDDHTQYILVDGTRSFTGKIGGVATVDSDTDDILTTKGYVDSLIPSTYHSDLDGLDGDDHTQYSHVDGRRPFDITSYFPRVSNNGIVPDGSPSDLWDLTTKQYVDSVVSSQSSVELLDYVDIYGRHSMNSDQYYQPISELDPFIESTGNLLVNKDYVDSNFKRFCVSSGDGLLEYFDTKIETNDLLTTTSICNGVDTGVDVDKTTELYGLISRVEVVDGGVGFFVFDTSGDTWTPSTFDTDVFDVSGTGGQSITETVMYPPNDGAGSSVDIRVSSVQGNVSYFQIIDQTLSGTTDGTYEFIVNGNVPDLNRSVWSVTVVSDVITSIQQVSAVVGLGYSVAYDVTSISGVVGTFTLRPYITGTIKGFDFYDGDFGTGYALTEYTLTEATKASFTVSGTGTTDLGTTELIFHNPINEKLKFSHHISPTTPVALYDDDFTVSIGNVISGITFDKWGHITQITESAQPSDVWEVWVSGDLEFNKSYFVDATAGPVTLVLGSTPVIGDTIVVDDYMKQSSINNITIQGAGGANTLTIEGVTSQDMIINISSGQVTMVYVDETYGWRIKVN